MAGGCRKTQGVPKLEPFIVSGTPSEIYDLVCPRIQKIIPIQTQIVRIDNAKGMVIRFSTNSPIDNSVRLLEIAIDKFEQSKSRVSISAEKFSFVSKKNHDLIDLDVEKAISSVFINGS